MLSVEQSVGGHLHQDVEDPPLARLLFQSTASSVTLGWLAVRLGIGWLWLGEGWPVLANSDTLNRSGQAMLAYWQAGLADSTPGGEFLRGAFQLLAERRAELLVANTIASAEVLIGLAVVLGVFVGLAATGWLLLASSIVLLVGSGGANPLLSLPAILLMLAWKNAGYIGFDRYLLRALGAPWWKETLASSYHPPRAEPPGRSSARRP